MYAMQKDLFSRNEPPSIGEAYFCLGLGYLEGYGNPAMIKELNETYNLSKTEPIIKDENIFSKMFATGLCWSYDKNIPKI
jgi:hypothetical protein